MLGEDLPFYVSATFSKKYHKETKGKIQLQIDFIIPTTLCNNRDSFSALIYLWQHIVD